MLSRSILIVAVSLVLAACGGGGSGGGGEPVSRTPKVKTGEPTPPAGTDTERDTERDTEETSLVIPSVPSSAPSAANIAKSRPRPGSITQSSRFGGDGITSDRIIVTHTPIFNGIKLSIANGIDGNNLKWTMLFTNAEDRNEHYERQNYLMKEKGLYSQQFAIIEDNDERVGRNREANEDLYLNHNFIYDGIYLKHNFNKAIGGTIVNPDNKRKLIHLEGYFRETDYLTLGMWWERANDFDAEDDSQFLPHHISGFL